MHKHSSFRLIFAALIFVSALRATSGVVVGSAENGISRSVTFTFHPAHAAQTVAVAGTFNQWNMKSDFLKETDSSGTYTIRMVLPPGVYEYKFVVDGSDWQLDPDNSSHKSEAGFENSVLRVPGPDGSVPTPDITTATQSAVTFNYNVPGARSVVLLWGVDNWKKPSPNAIPSGSRDLGQALETHMNGLMNGTFTVSLPNLPTSSTLDFCYHITDPVEVWDNNGEQGKDFHIAVKDALTSGITRHFEILSSASSANQTSTASPSGRHDPDIALIRLSPIGICSVIAFALALVALCCPGARRPSSKTLLPGQPEQESPPPSHPLPLPSSNSTSGAPAFPTSLRWPLWARLTMAVAIGVLAFAIRYIELKQQGTDMDEGDYVPISQSYAVAIANHDLPAMINEPRVTEHPRLGLVLYASAIKALARNDSLDAARDAARIMSALLAAACALILAIRWPIAGILWALHGLGVRYTCVAYLDSVVTFFAVACVLSFAVGSRRKIFQSGLDERGTLRFPVSSWLWFFLSALCAGLAVSSKYIGVVAPLAITCTLIWWAVRGSTRNALHLLGLFVAYTILALAAMWASDVHLWTAHPIARIMDRIHFHVQFSHNEIVRNANNPWYHQLSWLWGYTEMEGWGPVWAIFDRCILLAGILGLPFVWKREPLAGIAWVVTLIFLFLWPTKWPQYAVIFVPWLCIAAQAALDTLIHRAARCQAP